MKKHEDTKVKGKCSHSHPDEIKKEASDLLLEFGQSFSDPYQVRSTMAYALFGQIILIMHVLSTVAFRTSKQTLLFC